MDKYADKSVKELLSLFETDTSTLRFDRTGPLKAAFDKLEKTEEKSKLEDVRKEILVHDLTTRTKSGRFGPIFVQQYKDGSEIQYPDIRHLPKDAMGYYRKRAVETKNPILEARYCDFIWTQTKDVNYAIRAVDAYVACSEIYFTNAWDGELADAINRAIEVAISINNSGLTTHAVGASISMITTLSHQKRYRYTLDLIEFLVDNHSKLKAQLPADLFIPHLNAAIDYLAQNKDDSYHMQRSFLEVLAKAQTKLGDKGSVDATRERIAESFVQEAEWKKDHMPKGELVAATIYQEALKAYTDLGRNPHRIEEIKVEIQKLLGKAKETAYNKVETKISIPDKAIEDFVTPYQGKSADEIIKLLSGDPYIVPRYEVAKKQAEEIAQEFALQHILPKQIMKGNMCVRVVTEDDEKIKYATIRQFSLAYHLTSHTVLRKIFDLLAKQNSAFTEDILKYLSECDYLSAEHLKLIEAGLKSFKDGNFIASFHVLVFQVEGLIRDLLERIGVATFTFRQNRMKATYFSELVIAFSEIEGVDLNFAKLIDCFLSDVLADNLRNYVAHALAESKDLSIENNYLLIFILVRLASYKLVETTP